MNDCIFCKIIDGSIPSTTARFRPRKYMRMKKSLRSMMYSLRLPCMY